MKPIKIIASFLFLLLSITFYNCTGSKKMTFDKANTATECEQKNGYWYKGKCWANFEEEGYSVDEIDEAVKKEMVLIENAQIKVNDIPHPVLLFMPEMDGKEIIFITIFEDEAGAKTIIQPSKTKQVKSSKFNANAILLDGNLMQMSEDETAMNEVFSHPLASGEMQTIVHNLDELDLEFSGLLKNSESEKEYQIDYRTNEAIMGAGTSTVEVIGNEIHINGELGTRTYHQLKTTIANHPNAKTAVLGNINGSLNDEVNMHTGRILRAAGLTTKVLKNSVIASGGVDLFCAGKERIVEKGAKIGIHSWCCLNDLTAAEIPQDHPAHQYQIEFFTMCMGAEIGPDFYFHTLTSAPFDGVHWMSDEDIKKWTVATKFVE